MAIAHVQDVGAQSSGAVASLGVTFASPTGSGNAVLAGIAFYQEGAYTLTDDHGNTYRKDVQKGDGGNNSCASWSAQAGSTATLTVTVTNTGGSKYTSIGVAEFSGVDYATTPLTSSNTVSTSPTDAGAIDSTSLGNGALYFAVLVFGSGGTCTVGGSFADVYKNTSAANQPIATDYYVQPTSGSLTPSWTMGTSPQGRAACAAAFKASSAASGAISGTAAGTSTATGTLLGAGACVGAAAGVAVASAVPQGAASCAGASAGSSTCAATPQGAGTLAGSAAGVGSASGVPSGAGSCVGSAAGTSTASAVPSGGGTLTGSAPGTSIAAGSLQGAGALAGSSAGTSTCSLDQGLHLSLQGFATRLHDVRAARIRDAQATRIIDAAAWR